MRTRFDQQLEKLNSLLVRMGALVENSIQKASQALHDKDRELALRVVAGDDEIDAMEKEIESLCLKLLLNQHPVAKDLRQISVALKMITDLERMGDQAQDISRICLELSSGEGEWNKSHALDLEGMSIDRMALSTQDMVKKSIDAFVRRDMELAQNVIEYDDKVDLLYREIKRELIFKIHQDADCGEWALALHQIAKYLERIGDHAVNVAEWVIFSITGEHGDYGKKDMPDRG